MKCFLLNLEYPKCHNYYWVWNIQNVTIITGDKRYRKNLSFVFDRSRSGRQLQVPTKIVPVQMFNDPVHMQEV